MLRFYIPQASTKRIVPFLNEVREFAATFELYIHFEQSIISILSLIPHSSPRLSIRNDSIEIYAIGYSFRIHNTSLTHFYSWIMNISDLVIVTHVWFSLFFHFFFYPKTDNWIPVKLMRINQLLFKQLKLNIELPLALFSRYTCSLLGLTIMCVFTIVMSELVHLAYPYSEFVHSPYV